MSELLGHGAWLRRLAGHLVTGSDGAEDAVQETWLAAMRAPPSADDDVRPWLARVLRNALSRRARTDSRRRARERAAAAGAPEAGDSLAASLEQLELQRQLTRLVTELEEPYRATIVMRYFEGKSAAEIARSQEIPPGTVRWRTKEALDRLRQRLDEAHGGNRKAWSVALAPVAGAGAGPFQAPPGGRGTVTLNKVVALSSVALVVGAGALLTMSAWQERGRPIDIARIVDPSPPKSAGATAPSPTSPSGPNVDDREGDETAMKRNRIRRAVQAMAIAAGAAGASAQSAPMATGIKVPAALDKAVVERVVADHINEVKWCYEQERAKNPDLRGRVTVQFTVALTGKVSDSKVESSTTANAALETCVSRCPRRWEFPRPKDDRPATVTYPFEFPLAGPERSEGTRLLQQQTPAE